ncbi:MAG: 1,4-dihydroxy-2-naphthoate octaprenyltransferase [Desulfatiglandaceae bacterium]|jgi:1,4-dihydroxy-2-naphthoate octaprenyltransferase
MSSIALWWRAVRPFSFTVSVIPPILGAVLAVLGNPGLEINWFRLILTLIGCMTAHAGANLLSDYYDYKVHVDREDTFGSSGLLVGKIMQPKQIFKGGVIVISVALGIGLYLVSVTPNGLFLLGLIFIGGILGVFYTAQPFAFKYRALGDIAVFISFGSAMVLGAYYVQVHRFSWAPVLYALPIALLVDAILHSNNLRDIESDEAVHIKTIPILIGEKASKWVYYGLIFGAYVLILILIVWAGLPMLSLLTFLSLPLAIKLVKMVRDKEKMPEKQFAMIDAATAQFHLTFGVLMIISLIIHLLIH